MLVQDILDLAKIKLNNLAISKNDSGKDRYFNK